MEIKTSSMCNFAKLIKDFYTKYAESVECDTTRVLYHSHDKKFIL